MRLLSEVLVSIPDDLLDFKKCFEDDMIELTTAPKALAIIASEAAKHTSAIAPVAWYAAKIVKQYAKDSEKESVLTPPSSLLSGLEPFSSEARKNRKYKKSKKLWFCFKSFVFSSFKETWSLKEVLK